jgi:porin
MLKFVCPLCLALMGPCLAFSQDSLHDVAYELGGVELAACESSTAGMDCGSGIGCGDEIGCATCCNSTQSTILGNCKAHLQESGITFVGNVTHFAFGVEGGINSPIPPVLPLPLGQGDTFKYTGRGEYNFIVDLEKYGGLPHGKLLIGAQHWWGEFGNVSLNTGALVPAVFPALLPPEANNPGRPYITDFLFTQPLSEKLVLFAGKKNVVGAADQDFFAGGDGTNMFINQALIANPAMLLAMPYSGFTTGIVMPQKWGAISTFVYDPQDRTRDFFRLQDLFSKGVIAGGSARVNTKFFDKPGQHHVGGLWKHLDQLDISAGQAPALDYPYAEPPFGAATLRDGYTIFYGFDQYFQTFPGERRSALPKKPPRGWGMFGRASVSDGNPTPFDYFLSAGIGGDSRLGNDRGDTFGIGWYYTGVSGEYGAPVAALFGPRDGTGVELFYNFQVTRCINITPDVQFIRPGLGNFTSGDDAFVYGLRANTRF